MKADGSHEVVNITALVETVKEDESWIIQQGITRSVPSTAQGFFIQRNGFIEVMRVALVIGAVIE